VGLGLQGAGEQGEVWAGRRGEEGGYARRAGEQGEGMHRAQVDRGKLWLPAPPGW
jgi:hypothetical protein